MWSVSSRNGTLLAASSRISHMCVVHRSLTIKVNTPPTQEELQALREKVNAREKMIQDEKDKRKREEIEDARQLQEDLKVQRTAQMKRFLRGPQGVLTVIGAMGVLWFGGNYLYGLYERTAAAFAEGKLMKLLEEEGADPSASFHFYLHAQIAHQILDFPDVQNHMGLIRFSPETMRMVPIQKENQLVVIANLYGSRRAGIVNVLFRKDVDSDGLPVFTPIDFVVDSWDGRLWDIPASPIRMSDLYAEVVRNRTRGASSRGTPAVAKQ